MAFTYVTLQRTYETATDLPARGTVDFIPVDQMRNGLTVVAAPVTATLDAAGAISIRLAATTDPATTPVGVTYKVVERITGQSTRTYYVSVPHDEGGTLQLADLTELSGTGGAAGFALRNASDYDDAVAPTDGQVMTWDGTTSKFHPENPTGGGGAVSSVNGSTGAVTITATGLGAQPIDTDLTAISALAPADGSLMSRQAGAWTGRSTALVKTDLGVATDIAAAVTALVNGAPSNRDTLGEIATALATTDSTAATLATTVAGKAPTASPTFTGTATAPRFVTPPVTLTAVSGVITPDAALSCVFRHTATADVILADPANGVDAQEIVVRVTASGADRSLSFASGGLAPVTIVSGQTYVALLRLDGSSWLLDDDTAVGGGGGAVSSVNGLTGVVVLGADDIAEGASHKFLTAAERSTIASIPPGGSATDSIARANARAGVLAIDTFTRPDASTVGLTLETGQSWEQQAGAPSVASGRLTAAAAFVVAADVGRADQDVRCKITVAAGTASSLCFRVGPTSADRLALALDTTNGFRLNKVDTGATTPLDTVAQTFTAGQTYEVRAVAAGAVITCYLDGSPLITHTLDTGEQTKYGAYTRVGLRQSGTTATFFDDLSVRVPYPSASGSGLPTGSFSVYIATGDDSNLTAALASAPAEATLVAVAVAGS